MYIIYGCLMHSAAVWVCGLGGGGNIGERLHIAFEVFGFGISIQLLYEVSERDVKSWLVTCSWIFR